MTHPGAASVVPAAGRVPTDRIGFRPPPARLAAMTRWYGKFLGLIAGWLLLRHPAGGLLGLLVGHAFDSDWFKRPSDAPYHVFGLDENATDAQIDHAYRRLMSQYHPDKLAGAAPELQRQAETRAREINAAYDRIKALRKRG